MTTAANGGGATAPRSSLSLRSRLLLASAVVQIIMLGLLVYSGAGVMERKLAERARLHLEDKKELLSAALAMPLMHGDRAKVQDVLDRARRSQEMYLVLIDRKGKVFASSGWGKARPPPSRESMLLALSSDGVFRTEIDVGLGAERYGRLIMGVPAEFFSSARRELIGDCLAIGMLALLLSTGLMTAVSYWLTRNLSKLSAKPTPVGV